MRARWWLFLFVLLHGPEGRPVWIVDSQVVAVMDAPGIGAAPTMVVTMGGNFYVREDAAEVAKKFGWSPAWK